jgi:hypothetical protein
MHYNEDRSIFMLSLLYRELPEDLIIRREMDFYFRRDLKIVVVQYGYL